MKPDYENALKFSDTNYDAQYINLDKLNDDYKSKVNSVYSIGNIYITGAGYVDYPFSNASPESPLGWEEFVWKTTPSRNPKFIFDNMDTIDVGTVARCEVNIKYMNYADFCVFREIVNTERRFKVKFFNVDRKQWVARDMYCAENSKSRLFTLKESLIGVLDMSIKLVGTNLDLGGSATYTISYNLNGGSGITPSSITNITQASQETLSDGTGITAPTGKSLVGWQTIDNGTVTGSYGLGQSITVWKNLALYAWYKDAETNNL